MHVHVGDLADTTILSSFVNAGIARGHEAQDTNNFRGTNFSSNTVSGGFNRSGDIGVNAAVHTGKSAAGQQNGYNSQRQQSVYGFFHHKGQRFVEQLRKDAE